MHLERGLTELHSCVLQQAHRHADVGMVLFALLPLQGTGTDEQHWLSSSQSPTTGKKRAGAGTGLAFYIPQD